MTLPEWITRYTARAEPFLPPAGYLTYYEPTQGFFLWRVFGNVFDIDAVCTNDWKKMYEVMNEMAKVRGCKILRTVTFHKPASFMRMLKTTPNLSLSGIRSNGKMYWCMEKLVK